MHPQGPDGLTALSNVPSVKELCDSLGFADAPEKIVNGFTDHVHGWRKTYVGTDGRCGTDLVDWKSSKIREALDEMAAKFLDEGGFGLRHWSPSRPGVKDSDLKYPEDKMRIVALLKQLFWKQNRYAVNNAKYTEKLAAKQNKSKEESRDVVLTHPQTGKHVILKVKARIKDQNIQRGSSNDGQVGADNVNPVPQPKLSKNNDQQDTSANHADPKRASGTSVQDSINLDIFDFGDQTSTPPASTNKVGQTNHQNSTANAVIDQFPYDYQTNQRKNNTSSAAQQAPTGKRTESEYTSPYSNKRSKHDHNPDHGQRDDHTRLSAKERRQFEARRVSGRRPVPKKRPDVLDEAESAYLENDTADNIIPAYENNRHTRGRKQPTVQDEDEEEPIVHYTVEELLRGIRHRSPSPSSLPSPPPPPLSSSAGENDSTSPAIVTRSTTQFVAPEAPMVSSIPGTTPSTAANNAAPTSQSTSPVQHASRSTPSLPDQSTTSQDNSTPAIAPAPAATPTPTPTPSLSLEPSPALDKPSSNNNNTNKITYTVRPQNPALDIFWPKGKITGRSLQEFKEDISAVIIQASANNQPFPQPNEYVAAMERLRLILETPSRPGARSLQCDVETEQHWEEAKTWLRARMLSVRRGCDGPVAFEIFIEPVFRDGEGEKMGKGTAGKEDEDDMLDF